MIGTAKQKWDMETHAEAKDRRRRARDREHEQCYADVDKRDQKVCRVTGVQLWAGAADPKKRLERHHMVKPKRFNDTPDKVLTVSRWIHDQLTANKLHVEGDANLRDLDGKLCGVKVERPTDAGWEVVKWC